VTFRTRACDSVTVPGKHPKCELPQPEEETSSGIASVETAFDVI